MMHETLEVYLNPEERHFLTPEMRKTFRTIGRPEEVVDQIKDLHKHGVQRVKCNFPSEHAEEMMRDFTHEVIARM